MLQNFYTVYRYSLYLSYDHQTQHTFLLQSALQTCLISLQSYYIRQSQHKRTDCIIIFPFAELDSTKISAFTDFYQMEFAKSICIKRRSIYLFMNTHKELHVSILSISLPLLCTTSLLYYSHSWESHIWSYTSFELSSSPLPCISLHSLSHSTITTIHPWLRLINIPG